MPGVGCGGHQEFVAAPGAWRFGYLLMLVTLMTG